MRVRFASRALACALFLLLVIASVDGVRAQDSSRVAVVNVQLLLRDSTAMKGVHDQVEQERQRFQDQISREETQLQNMSQEIEKQRNVLSPEAFQARQEEFQKKVADFQSRVQERGRKLEQAFQKAVSDFETSVVDVAEEIAKEHGYTMVVARAQVVYYDESHDITTQALERLNQRLPSLQLNFSEN